MKLENQVVNLELSKKLKELGVKQDSYFYWQFDPDDFATGRWNIVDNPYLLEKDISAYTVAELFDICPDGFRIGVRLVKTIGGYLAEITDYDTMPYQRIHITRKLHNPADTMAKAVEYLIENKLI